MRRLRFIIGAILTVLWVVPARAQEATGTIRGRIIDDATQQPLARVTVAVGTRGALTGMDGRYVLNGVAAGAVTVRARILGYAPATRNALVVGGGTVVVDVTMSAQAITLSEVVVTGYGEQSVGDITGAVTHLSNEDFNPGRITAPGQLIQSKVAGVQVSDNNEPGGGMSIRIRGTSSANAGNEPLYVIDGMPVGTGSGGGLSAGRDPLSFLNPNDIESITVLKDASAASIYGTNAANGVVLIQTKSGSAGGRMGTQIEYSSSYSTSSVTKLPSVLSAAQFTQQVAAFAPSRSAMLGTANTDWLGLVDRTSSGLDQNVSLSSASENLFYRLSLGYLTQDGIIRGSNTQRLSLGVNFDQHALANHLDIRANFKGSRTNDQFTPGGVLGSAVSMAPTQPVYDPTNAQGYGTGYWDWVTAGASASNPVALMNLSSDHGTTWRSIGNIQSEYRFPFFEALKATVNLGYDIAKTDRETFIPSTLAGQVRQGHGQLSLSNNTQMNTVAEAYLNYAAPLNYVPGNIDVTAGYSYSQSHSTYPSFNETGLSSNLLGDNGVVQAANVTNSLFVVDSKLISFFGRVNYNYNDRYIAAFSVRRDGSSRFGPGNQWGTFPSASVAWRISQESFMRGFTSLSDLKLRASWAKTGNQAIGDYLFIPTYSYGDGLSQVQFGNQFITTIRPSAVDPNIKWEATASTNIGLDFGFLNQRFSGSIDWYTKKTTDMIFYVPVAAGSAFSNFETTNIGSMQNKGIELSLSARIIDGRGRNLTWTADFTASHNANELLSINPHATSATQILTGGISGGVGNTIQVLEPGVPVNSFFVCQQYYSAGKPVENKFLAVKQNAAGDSTVTGCTNDRRAYHNPAPTWQLGHTSRMTWHDFDFSFTLRAYLGNYVYNNVASANGFLQGLTNGGSPSNLSTSVLKTGFVTPQYLSDYYVESASFLRMDNITLGYTFHLAGAPWRAYASVQNVFTITGYSGVDPTAGLNGLDNNIYPRSRTVTGGLSVRF